MRFKKNSAIKLLCINLLLKRKWQCLSLKSKSCQCSNDSSIFTSLHVSNTSLLAIFIPSKILFGFQIQCNKTLTFSTLVFFSIIFHTFIWRNLWFDFYFPKVLQLQKNEQKYRSFFFLCGKLYKQVYRSYQRAITQWLKMKTTCKMCDIVDANLAETTDT